MLYGPNDKPLNYDGLDGFMTLKMEQATRSFAEQMGRAIYADNYVPGGVIVDEYGRPAYSEAKQAEIDAEKARASLVEGIDTHPRFRWQGYSQAVTLTEISK